MSALSGFLGGAIIGAGTAYTKLADEQRAFRIDQTKQDALYARMLNLKRAEKGMEKSGVLDESGLPMTNEQLEGYGGDRGALMGPVDQAAKLQKIKEADQPSQFMTQDRVVLTKGEVADYVKNNGSMEGLIPIGLQARQDKVSDQARSEYAADQRAERSESRYYAKMDAQEKAAEAKRIEAIEKEERTKVSTVSTQLQKTIMERVEDVQTKWDNMDLAQHRDMEKGESLEAWKNTSRVDAAVDFLKQVPPAYKEQLMAEDPSIRELISIPRIVRSGKLGGMSTEEVTEALVSEGYTPEQARMVTDYAITKGYAKHSPKGPLRWDEERRSWERTPVYRMKKR